jgi:hypothetical protein
MNRRNLLERRFLEEAGLFSLVLLNIEPILRDIHVDYARRRMGSSYPHEDSVCQRVLH